MNNRDAWRERSQRRRVAHELGLVPVRLWVTQDQMTTIEIIAEETESMIDEAVAMRYPEKSPEE
jgi:hypothetical protein